MSKENKTLSKQQNGNDFITDVTFRYLLFSKKDLGAKLISKSNNKQELKKIRTGWRFQIMLQNVSGEIYDTKTCKWIP